MTLYDCRTRPGRGDGLAAAARTVRTGGLVVLPTDTVYGIGADAFDPAAVRALLAAKGRGRSVPPPVLVGGPAALAELAPDAPPAALRLAEKFWPGGLTLVVRHAPGLSWDLGDAGGTVGVRMPDHPVALDLLRATGPMAVSSANLHGSPPVETAAEAVTAFGESVVTYLEAGRCPGGVPSTVLSLVGERPRVLRSGAVGADALRALLPDLADPDPRPRSRA
jgi:L-threonylcarbamoyladenylate synthase